MPFDGTKLDKDTWRDYRGPRERLARKLYRMPDSSRKGDRSEEWHRTDQLE